MVVWDEIIVRKSSVIVSVILFARATFVKINYYLVVRIVSYDTAGLHLLTFHILQSYSSKDIELDLSHVILQ